MGGATAARSRRLGLGRMRRLLGGSSSHAGRGEAAGGTSWVGPWVDVATPRGWEVLESVEAQVPNSRRLMPMYSTVKS